MSIAQRILFFPASADHFTVLLGNGINIPISNELSFFEEHRLIAQTFHLIQRMGYK